MGKNATAISKLRTEAEALLLQMRGQRCQQSHDPVQWAERALGFELDTWQRQIMQSNHPRLVVVAARQSGKSVVTGAKAAHEAATRPNYRVVTVAPSFRQSGLLADKIEVALEANGVPYQRLREIITLENGSSIKVLHGDRPATLRGHTADLLLADELGFARADLAPVIFPMLGASGGRLVAISSPNGPSGPLYDLSQKGGVELIKVPAADVSHFDQAVITELRGRLGPALARQELDAEFVASASSVFSADVLDTMFAPLPLADPIAAEADAEAEAAEIEQERRAQTITARRMGLA